MTSWPHKVLPMTRDEIQHAIDDDRWQHLRLSMKGMTTENKLRELHAYRVSEMTHTGIPRVVQVRIDNYINALLRGGQLVHKDNQIVVQR